MQWSRSELRDTLYLSTRFFAEYCKADVVSGPYGLSRLDMGDTCMEVGGRSAVHTKGTGSSEVICVCYIPRGFTL